MSGTSFPISGSLVLPAETTEHYPAVWARVEDHIRLRGRRLGDPVTIERAGHRSGPLPGFDAHAYATAEVEALRSDLDANAAASPTTDFPAA